MLDRADAVLIRSTVTASVRRPKGGGAGSDPL